MGRVQGKSKQNIRVVRCFMLFKDCKFNDKSKVRKTFKEDILLQVKPEIPFSKCNEGRILEYIDILLDESQYNVREEQFYYKYRYVKIGLDADLFSKVTIEYIKEHLEDFILEKHKKTIN